MIIIQREDANVRKYVTDTCDELDIVSEDIMSTMDKLFERYKTDKDT